MSNYSFDATLRTTDFGSAGSRRLVRAGKVPAVVYGHKIAPTHIVINAHKFAMSLSKLTESTLIKLNIDGMEEKEVLVKNFQEDLLYDVIKHVDFYEVNRNEKLRTSVPVVIFGNPIGCRKGGILDAILHEIEVQCLPKDLPSELKVDVSELDLNAHLTVADIVVGEGVEILTPSNATIAIVKALKEEVVEEVADANAPAEVISEASDADAETTV
jgi:large subunit ribosomal protein L25